MSVTPSASFSLTLRIELDNEPGMLGEVTSAIGEAGGSVGAIDIVKAMRGKLVRDDSDHRHCLVRQPRDRDS